MCAWTKGAHKDYAYAYTCTQGLRVHVHTNTTRTHAHKDCAYSCTQRQLNSASRCYVIKQIAFKLSQKPKSEYQTETFEQIITKRSSRHLQAGAGGSGVSAYVCYIITNHYKKIQ